MTFVLLPKLLRVTTLFFLVSVGLLRSAVEVNGLWCDRTPAGVNDPKTAGDNGYRILISGESDKYIPGAVYTVRLQGPGDQYTVDKFSGFLLVAEPADGHSPESSSGSFQLTTDSLARFSEYCPHAVKHASELPKAEVQVRWTAPPVSAGCVVFRATVVKNKGQWFMDDGELTKQLCPENDYGLDENDNFEPCCACDEAKYELTFEGLWSSLTHPKDFPADTLSAHFSDIIGASHSPTFRFWEYGGEASDGLKQVAEGGDPRDLESELKDKSGNIRTIIKARGLKNPNFYGYKTFAVFRADRDHNLISLVSKIDPSPDWFVGVAGLNLCLSNCSWVSNKVVNLFPWDAGTNNGVSYSPPGDSTNPRDRIRRIVWTNNEKSPFYDPSGNMVKPFARLRLVKQRSYDRSCDSTDTRRIGGGGGSGTDSNGEDMYDDSDHQHNPECQVSLWTEWSSCSATCGKGAQTRTRQYVNPNKAADFQCNRKLYDKKNCYNSASCKKPSYTYSAPNYNTNTNYGSSKSSSSYGGHRGHHSHGGGSVGGGHGKESNNPCATTEWHAWSQCSATCGRGKRTRERKYVHSSLAEENNCNKLLIEHEICHGAIADCSNTEQVEEGCETTQWSEWGPCSVTCGRGRRARTRYFADPRINHQKCFLELRQEEACAGLRTDCSDDDKKKEICKLPKVVGVCPNDGNLTRWYFDSNKLRCQKFTYQSCMGNENNFLTEKDCENSCSVLRENLSDMGFVSGNGYAHGRGTSGYGNLHNNGYNNNGAGNSNSNSNNHGHSYGGNSRSGHSHGHSSNNWPSYQAYSNPADGPDIDCVVSEWSDWSRCSNTCGRGHKSRTRYIKVFSQNNGRPCPQLKITRKCKDLTCEPGHPYRYMGYDYQE